MVQLSMQTLGIVKPHAVLANNHIQIVDMIMKAGMQVEYKRVRITERQAAELYREHQERTFYGEMCREMTSSDVILMRITGSDDVVAKFRDLMGSTDPASAAEGTIRKQFGVNIGQNAVHGSDSKESAERELKIFASVFDSTA